MIRPGRPPTLRIYVTPGCAGCEIAAAMAGAVRRALPCREVVVIDLADDPGPLPAGVIGTPTYLLDDEVISLGNPEFAQLLRVLDSSEPDGEYEGSP